MPRPPHSRSRPLARLLLVLLLAIGTQAKAASLQRWIYCSQNLWVDQQVAALETLLRRAAAAGYTHVLISDSKFSKLGDMDARYFKNIQRVKKLAAELNLELVPALFSVGYSNDLLWHDPNLIEALPTRDVPFMVEKGVASLVPDPDARLKGGDFSDLKLWGWKDPTVSDDHGAALIRNPGGQNARVSQKVKVHPFRQYHVSVRVKTQDFRGTPELKVLAGNSGLNYNSLGVKPTQDWTTHHAVFNSLSNQEVTVYLGCWGGGIGSLWFDDAILEEVALVNLVRRGGAPLVVRNSAGQPLKEGQDFQPLSDPLLGVHPWKGAYDIYHSPPPLQTALPDGVRLSVSYYHGVTVNDDQAMICPSEPKTLVLLRDQARRMHDAWGTRSYMMSHDEIRVLNWCDACQRRHLDAGALLADHVRSCAKILREVNPGGKIYVWSDMFDPNHNAHGNYYLVRGDLAGSWEGLDKDIIIVPWYFGKRAESLRWFAGRGHQQVIAGYYDHNPLQIRDWLDAARGIDGVIGVMYTTWAHKFDDLEKFAEAANGSR